MGAGLRPAGVNSSDLVRLLAEGPAAGVAAPAPDIAGRLGQWLGWTDAIALAAALGGPQTDQRAPMRPDAPRSAPSGAAAATAAAALDRLRATLLAAIAAEGPGAPAAAGAHRGAPPPAEPPEALADFATHRRRHAALQRTMAAPIAALRHQLRALLAGQSADGARLAALDAVLDEALAAREAHLLGRVPELLAPRFERLRQAHHQRLAASGAADDPAHWARPGGWLAAFGDELRAALRAELDTRLQPLEGLLDALRPPATNAP